MTMTMITPDGQRPLLPKPPLVGGFPPGGSPAAGVLPTQHTEREWADVYPLIECMYVEERRSLKELMRAMEERHNFKATVQMYKKRFAKWGFHKNARRDREGDKAHSRPTSDRSTALVRAARSTTKTPRILQFSASDAAQLAFLASIQAWSIAFFDRTKSDSAYPSLPSPPPEPSALSTATSGRPRPRDINSPEQLSFSFRLIIGLLERDEGVLAGRLTRKAFLQAEALLDAEGPLFIWNTLEIFHNIALLRQAKLGYMLLNHLISLAGDRPMSKVLRRLYELLQAWQRDNIPARPDALERAWTLNADLTFSHFDPQYLLMYYQLVWDSDMVKLGPEIMRHSDRWFSMLHDKVDKTRADDDEGTAAVHLWPEHELISPRESGFRGAAPQPANFEQLKKESLGGFYQIADRVSADSTMKVRVLSAQMKSQVLRDDTAMPTHPGLDIPRLQARIMAYITKIIMDVENEEKRGTASAINRMKLILTLREYGQGLAGPQLVYGMWQLEELLVRAGLFREAAELRAESYRRLEHFLADIP